MVIYTFSKACKSPTASLSTGHSLAMVTYWNFYCFLAPISRVCKSPTASLSTGDSLVMDSYWNFYCFLGWVCKSPSASLFTDYVCTSSLSCLSPIQWQYAGTNNYSQRYKFELHVQEALGIGSQFHNVLRMGGRGFRPMKDRKAHITISIKFSTWPCFLI